MVADSLFTAEWILNRLIPLLADAPALEKMAAASAAQGIRDADRRMAEFIFDANVRSRA